MTGFKDEDLHQVNEERSDKGKEKIGLYLL
jgi:hypothetical protein